MKKFIAAITLSLALTPSFTWAQTAREVLDATAARLSAPNIKARFKASQFEGATQQGEATGTLLLSGRRYQVRTNEMVTWYDGTTQWAMMNGANEVNVTVPTEEEQAQMNPSTLIGIYKKGYKYSLRSTTLRGKQVFEVHLQAKNKGAYYSEIYVDVEKGTYMPLCFRAKHGTQWLRLSVLSFQTGATLPASTFTFPSQDYPQIEVIDLRN